MNIPKKVLVTGSTGFIGSAVCLYILARGDEVIGIDNHNDYYDPTLKEARLARHAYHPSLLLLFFTFTETKFRLRKQLIIFHNILKLFPNVLNQLILINWSKLLPWFGQRINPVKRPFWSETAAVRQWQVTSQ